MSVANLVRVSLHGVGDGEEFLVGWHVQGPEPAGFDDLQAACDDFAGTFPGEAWTAQVRSFLSTEQRFDKVIMAYYAVSGGAADFSVQSAIAAGDGTGTGAAKLPLQTTICVSTATSRPGPSGRGRMYWPATGVGLGAGHLLTAGNADDQLNAVHDGMQHSEVALAGHTGGVANSVVYSPHLDLATEINRMSIDNRVDIQRRRAASQTVTHVATVPYP